MLIDALGQQYGTWRDSLNGFCWCWTLHAGQGWRLPFIVQQPADMLASLQITINSISVANDLQVP